MRFDQTKLLRGLLLLAAISLAACGGGGGSTPTPVVIPTPTYSVSVNVSGLTGGTLGLYNRNYADTLTVTAVGTYPFSIPVTNSLGYDVSVSNQPAGQFCTVASGAGNPSAPVTLAVSCVPAYTIGGNISGASALGIGLVLQLQNNGVIVENRSSTAGDTTFTFNTRLASGLYDVSVLSQPRSPRQNCNVTAGSGDLTATPANVNNVAVTCTDSGTLTDVPRFAYVANNDDTVSIYTVNAATGQLRPNGYQYIGSGSSLSTVTVDPSGKFLYVMNATTHNVSAYSINADTGKLTAVTGSPFSVGSTSYPSFGTVDPSGRFAYVTNTNSNDVSAYRIDLGTGALARVSCVGGLAAGCSGAGYLNYPVNYPSGGAPTSVAVHPTGAYAYVTNSNGVSVYGIDSYGALTATSNTTAGTVPNSISITPSGLYAYVANKGGTISAYTITAGALGGNGTTTLLSGKNLRSISVDPYGVYAFVANNTDNKVSAYAINVDGKLGTHLNLPGTAAGTGPVAVSADPSGKYAYVANSDSADVSVYTINAISGLLPAGSIRARSGSSSIALTRGLQQATNAPYPVTYTPLYAYVANSGSDNVSVYPITAGTGVLGTAVTGSPFFAEDAPAFVTVDPLGRFAYVANSGTTNNISVYEIDSLTGALSANTAASAGSGPGAVTVDPSGRFAYVANSDATVWGYSIDQAIGELTQIDMNSGIAGIQNITVPGSNPRSVAIDPTGRFAYVAHDSGVTAYLIAASNGVWSIAGTVAAGTTPGIITVDPTGKFAYVVNNGGTTVSAYLITASTGELGSETTVTNGAGLKAIAIDPAGKFAYVANNSANSVSGYSIDPTNGALVSIDTDAVTGGIQPIIAAGTGPMSVTVDISGSFLYVANTGGDVSAYSINTTTGALTSLGAATTAGTNPASITTTGTIQ